MAVDPGPLLRRLPGRQRQPIVDGGGAHHIGARGRWQSALHRWLRRRLRVLGALVEDMGRGFAAGLRQVTCHAAARLVGHELRQPEARPQPLGRARHGLGDNGPGDAGARARAAVLLCARRHSGQHRRPHISELSRWRRRADQHLAGHTRRPGHLLGQLRAEERAGRHGRRLRLDGPGARRPVLAGTAAPRQLRRVVGRPPECGRLRRPDADPHQEQGVHAWYALVLGGRGAPRERSAPPLGSLD
mmetsp:Transcript_90918/g.262049  ORF Transcript_90918/g.262049 Transcript_90918/m.262049 type:complete len:245 (+) Transcript_90918:123-857(+)